ncbi:MAG: homoserine O-succinyltransferase [Chloroflexi bacterium]|nr:homoserine O-succinyltransferase [Chloroflexota bacterium]
MTLRIPDGLPARETLAQERVTFVDGRWSLPEPLGRAVRIAILNLMPTKMATETQLLRLLGASPFVVQVTLLYLRSHQSRNTPEEHLHAFYQSFDQIQGETFDGLIITGAPVEHLEFEQVDYWSELAELLDWRSDAVYSTYHICWGAQAALYRGFGIPKYPLPEKMFGVFPHRVNKHQSSLTLGFDDIFYAPHSRHTEVRRADIDAVPGLRVLAESEEAGVFIAATTDDRQVFVTGHPEYDPLTLKAEYDRDANKGLPIKVPRHYYPEDDPSRTPVVRWRSHGYLLYGNWLKNCAFHDAK